MPLLHTKMIAALSIFATLWLNVNCFRPSKLSCCKRSQRTSVMLNNIVDDGSLETPEDLIVTLPKIMVRGLLTGILDISKAKDYSRTINIDLAADLLRDTKHVYHVALEETHGNDAERKNYLTEVIKKAKTFMENLDEVLDRDELKSAIQTILLDKGKFVCVLGGKSTGKTLVIKDMEKLNMGNVFVVDLRLKGSNIWKGLVGVILEREKFYQDVEEKGSAVTSNSDRARAFEELHAILKDRIFEGSVEQPLKVVINELLKHVDGVVTVIIDEANLAFAIRPGTTEEDVKAQRELLSFFTSLTKVQRKLNVILLSTEHAFPDRLKHARLEFVTVDITDFIFAGEVPPSKMYELLTTRWGMGHNLAVTLIDHYGGHIYDIVSQLEYLNRQGEDFVTVSQAQTDDVQRCLDFDGDKKRMRELLTQIAEKGFAPLSKRQDREAEAISKYNVGGLVQLQGATVIGLPFDVCGKHRIGLIPSKQSIRLIIAEVLHMNPEDLADNARADSTSVDEDLKIIEEQLTQLAMNIDDVESDIERSFDKSSDRYRFIGRKVELKNKEEQLREEKIILRRRQSGWLN